VHALVSVDTSPTTRKTRPFVDLDQNYCNFLPVGESMSYKRPNNCILRAQHSARSTKRRSQPNNSQNVIIRRFRRKMTAIFFPFVPFRRLNDQITACSAQNIVRALLSVETCKQLIKHDHSSNWTKNDCNFLPVGGISSYKRPTYCILSVEHSARCIKRRNQQTTHKTRSCVDFDEK
jgi:hypothetical protein